MVKNLEIVKNEHDAAICPHCEKEIGEVFYKAKGFPIMFGKHYMYFCPHCKKVLGFSQGRFG